MLEALAIVTAVAAVIAIPLLTVLGDLRSAAIWGYIALFIVWDYWMTLRGRAQVVSTLSILTAIWLPVADLAKWGPDAIPVTFMGASFALLVSALLETPRRTWCFGCMAVAAEVLAGQLHGPSKVEGLLASALCTFTTAAAIGSWASMQVFRSLENSSRHNKELSERLTRSNTELERSNAELERRVAQRTRTLEEMSIRDELTGLHNRRHVTQEMARLTQERQEVALMMLDVDHFKAVNDTLGHAVGDVVLQRIADLLRREVDTSGIVARFGGEEFVIVLPVGHDSVHDVAERLRAGIECLEWPDIPVPHGRVTASIGLSTAVLSDPKEGQALIARADQALYRAKANGRNRVERSAVTAAAGGL